LIIIAADASQRMRSVLEAGTVAVIVVLATVFFVKNTDRFVARAQLSEALSFSTSTRYDLVTYRASHGHWPASAADTDSSILRDSEHRGAYVESANLHDDGTVTFTFGSRDRTVVSLRQKRLSFRPGLVIGGSGSPISWYCGSRRPPQGIEILGADRTDIEPDLLMFGCRQD